MDIVPERPHAKMPRKPVAGRSGNGRSERTDERDEEKVDNDVGDRPKHCGPSTSFRVLDSREDPLDVSGHCPEDDGDGKEGDVLPSSEKVAGIEDACEGNVSKYDCRAQDDHSAVVGRIHPREEPVAIFRVELFDRGDCPRLVEDGLEDVQNTRNLRGNRVYTVCGETAEERHDIAIRNVVDPPSGGVRDERATVREH